MTTDASNKITVREGVDQLQLKLTLEQDYSNEVLVVYLIDELGDVYEIGEAMGVGAGEELTIAVTFDVPPSHNYEVEVGPEDRSLPPIWPERGEEGKVRVENIRYNDS